ncbi:MAG TPA: TonB-dependent receptor plug domain-containing protein, partial [Anaeromyxobacteraceae bacterium]|nr:TonB-dependent receptor plug domain-containing protein [Anaeromyxobacteraceae bacterium]
VLRGLKRDDVTVVVDGAHLHGACPSRMDPPSSHLDYAEVDHVEVKRGPFDVTQPGGLGGVIDVRTRAPRSGGFGSELNVGTGSSGALETSGVVSYAGARGDVLLGGAFKQAEPFRSGNGLNVTRAVPATVNGAPNPARYRNTSSDQVAYDVRSGWAKVGLAPAAGHRLELAYARQSSTDVLYPYLLMDGIRDDTDRVNATWSTGAAGPFSRALAQAYWSRVEHDMTDEDRCSSAANPGECTGALPRGFGMRTLAQSSVAGGKVEAVLGGERAGVTLGADTYFRRWDSTTTRVNRMAPGMPYASEASIPDVAIDDVGLYVEARRPLTDRLRVLGGARVDVAASEARADRTSVYRTFHPGSDRRSTTEALLAGNV